MDIMCLAFINSRRYREHRRGMENLESTDRLDAFCRSWGLPMPDISEQSCKRLSEFRENLFAMAMHFCREKKLSPQELDLLNSYLRYGVQIEQLRVVDDVLSLDAVVRVTGVELVIYKIALSFAELITQKTPEYLRKCGNPDCEWIFYDDSKSHTRKWCDNRCASLMKVRKHRAGKT